MTISRRQMTLVAAGVLATAALVPSMGAFANSADESAVAARVEALREATFKGDKAQLEDLAASSLSYGHSAGVVETKEQFINAIVTRKAIVKSLKWTDVKVAVTGNTAIVRHGWESVNEVDGKTSETKIGVVQVWQKFDGKWQLYARQAFRLPT